MVKLVHISTSHNTIAIYSFPADHSPQSVVEWIFALLNRTNNNEWINLENTTDSNDEGKDSISFKASDGISTIVYELSHRNIDNVLTHINISGCNVSVEVNIHSYILSVGVENSSADIISQVERIIDSL